MRTQPLLVSSDRENYMKIFNICTQRVYEINGEKKVSWYRVGFLKVTENGNQYIRLFQQPETTFFVFERDGEQPSQEAE